MDMKSQMEKGIRNLKYSVKYGTGIKVPNPIVRSDKEESIDVLMKRLYVMPMPKGGGVTGHNVRNFDEDDEGDDEEMEESAAVDDSSKSGSSSMKKSMSKRGSSSLSEGGSSSESSWKKGLGDDDENEGGEDEEDDGFGTLNISAQRLPTADNALTRFIRRAIVNNGEAAQITHLRNMAWASMPRSEEEILATLDARFYEQDFDPAQHMLESFPGQVDDFNTYIERQLSEKDIAKEYIMAQLATRVEANYHVLIEGMKNIQEVDLDLVSSGVQSVNSRRKLAIADHGMRDPIMRVLYKRIRRENLQKVANIVQGTHEVLVLEKASRDAAATGNFERAVKAATDAKLALDSEILSNVNMMDAVKQKLDQFLPELRLEVDKSLKRLCARGFSSVEYTWILKAYLTLDDHGVRLNSRPRRPGPENYQYDNTEPVEDSLATGIHPISPTVDRGGIPDLANRLHRFASLEIDHCIKTAIITTIITAVSSASTSTSSANIRSSLTTMNVASAASAVAKNLPSAVTGRSSPTPPAQPTQQGGQQVPSQQQQQQPQNSAAADAVRDVHGRIVAYKNKRLAGWSVSELIRQLPPGTALTALVKVAEVVSNVIYRYFLIIQWHRSPFDERNKDNAYLHRAVEQKNDMGDLSDEDDEENGDEDTDGSRSVSRGKKAGKSKKGEKNEDEEEEEEESDDEEDHGFDSPEDDDKIDAMEQTRKFRARRERLERARLATVARGLKQVRKQLWEPIEKTAVAMLKDDKEGSEEMGLEALIQLLTTGELLVALGEDFGKNESAHLKNLLRNKSRQFLEKTHQECFTVMRQMLDRETWYHVPISVDDLGGMAGVINTHSRTLAWPALNGWGHIVKERVLRGLRKKTAATMTPSSKQQQQNNSIFSDFLALGNPFSAILASQNTANTAPSKQQNKEIDEDLIIFDAKAAVDPLLASPGGLTALSTPSTRPPAWSITQAALNGFAKYTGRYLQIMSMAPSVARETHQGLAELLDFYIYMVFTLFVPEQSVQLFLTSPNHLNTEASVMEELNLVNHEVYVPLPCEEDEFSLLKNYLNRVRDELVESDHWNIFPVMSSAETASKIKKLGADTAKKFGALATGATTTTMAGFRGELPSINIMPPSIIGGGGGGGGQGGVSSNVGGVGPQSHGPSSQMASPTPGGGGAGEAQQPAPEKQRAILAKKVKIQRPAFIAESLEDEESLYGLSQRAVAIESCFFILEVLKTVQPKVLSLLPKKAAFLGTRGSCETYLETVNQVVSQLRVFAYRCAAPKLIGAAQVVRSVEGQDWNQNRIREEANSYTDAVCHNCRELCSKIHGPEEDGSSRMMVGGLDNMYFPPQVKVAIWTEIVQAAMGSLLEGFARIERCSTEGRSLMSMDLQAVQLGLDEIQRVRPGRGKVYVDNYIKAFYYGESDIMTWIAQNYKSYYFRHLAGLLSAGVGQKKKKKGLKDLITQVATLYSPEAPAPQP